MGDSFINIQLLIDLFVRMGIDFMSVFLLVKFIYFDSKKEREFAFTFFLFNIIIFFIAYLMMRAEISMGFAFGLFAIFGILRYRTDTIPIKEMTYLLAAIAIALVNTMVAVDLIVIIINLGILLATLTMEHLWFGNKEMSKNILYENISLTHESKKEELIEDLKDRTGLDIVRVRIRTLNYLNDSADLKIYYRN